MSSLTNGEWYPLDQIYYLDTGNKMGITTIKQEDTTGITGNFTGYDIQRVEVNPNEVLLVHISDDLDLHTCENILKELKDLFPNNPVVLCNEHILKGLTIIKPTTKIDDVVDISSNVDVDKLFDEIMRGKPNDFLY